MREHATAQDDFHSEVREDLIECLDEIERVKRLLPHLVDVVWGVANEDESVPSSEWAERMIAQAEATLDD